MEKIISTERKRVGDKVIETTIKELPLYRVNKVQAEWWFESGMVYDYLVNEIGCHFCLPKWKGSIHEIEIDRDSDNPMADFKKAIKEKYADKEFNFYFVQEYQHSGSVFHLTDTDTRVDSWDSGIVGFCALPKNELATTIANMLTDLWEGTIDAYEIWNNETDEIEETYEYWLYTNTRDEWKDMCKFAKENYGVDIEKETEGI